MKKTLVVLITLLINAFVINAIARSIILIPEEPGSCNCKITPKPQQVGPKCYLSENRYDCGTYFDMKKECLGSEEEIYCTCADEHVPCEDPPPQY